MAKTKEDGATTITGANVKSKDPADKNDKRDFLVTIYATDKAPHHAEGTETKVHPDHANKWIDKGWFTKTKPSKKEDDLI